MQFFECDKRRTCLYRWVEEVEVVLMVEVSSEMVACGGRSGSRKTCCHLAEAAAASAIDASSFA